VFGVTAVTAIAWPFYGFIGLFPLEVLRLMFGPQWAQSSPLVPLFCLAGAFSATISLIPTLMLAAGHSRLVAMADLLYQPVKAIALSMVVYCELRPFAIAFLLLAIASVPYFFAFKQVCLPNDLNAITRSCKKLIAHFLSQCPAIGITSLFRAVFVSMCGTRDDVDAQTAIDAICWCSHGSPLFCRFTLENCASV
jgi:lipopolysaccharide exporter